MEIEKDINMAVDMDEGSGMGDMMMQMYFYVSSSATILFSSWTTSSAAAMFGSCVAVFVAAMLYESIKILRARLAFLAKQRAMSECTRNTPTETEYTQLNVVRAAEEGAKDRKAMFTKDHLIQTALQFVQVLLGYSLMLVAMTFNLWLFLAVILGMTFGYFLLGWKDSPVSQECCA